MQVICFGDSNTYGYDPRSFLGGRYNAEDRWVDILAAKTGWNIQNCGLNGREIPQPGVRIPQGADLAILMLGTNDLLQGCSAAQAAGRMDAFLAGIPRENTRVLLVGPPPLQWGAWVTDPAQIGASAALAPAFAQVAARQQILFADAGVWNIPLAYDGVHFSAQGHHIFAENLHTVLQQQICGQ